MLSCSMDSQGTSQPQHDLRPTRLAAMRRGRQSWDLPHYCPTPQERAQWEFATRDTLIKQLSRSGVSTLPDWLSALVPCLATDSGAIVSVSVGRWSDLITAIFGKTRSEFPQTALIPQTLPILAGSGDGDGSEAARGSDCHRARACGSAI